LLNALAQVTTHRSSANSQNTLRELTIQG